MESPCQPQDKKGLTLPQLLVFMTLYTGSLSWKSPMSGLLPSPTPKVMLTERSPEMIVGDWKAACSPTGLPTMTGNL